MSHSTFPYTVEKEQKTTALEYARTAEQNTAQIITDAKVKAVTRVGVVGGGTMGTGIATAFLYAGFPVCLIEQSTEAADVARQRIESNFNSSIKRGKITRQEADQCLKVLNTASETEKLSDCQLIIEAVFEDMDIKKTLFRTLDKICDKSAIFATNTSYLDIDEIASATEFPKRVIGMHFFSPAHIMKLLEVIKGKQSSDIAIATVMEMAKKLGKVPVLAKVCFGFAANRMYSRYGREIQQMLLEGAKVAQIDKAMTDWGMAMGPLAVQDLSGIDIGYNARKTRPFPKHDPGYFKAAETLVEHNRLGRKTAAGFYHYDENGKSQPDLEVDRLIKQQSMSLGIEQRTFDDEEIVHRALMALISEGMQLFAEGIVQRLSDIDVIWLLGYGFPRFKGGPMFQAQHLGNEQLQVALANLREKYGEAIWPPINTA